MDAQNRRLNETRTNAARWGKWGPYLAERQWGTVREDYSESGDAARKFQEDPHRRDLVLFAGLGASHPTGWTGIEQVLELGKDAAVTEVASARRE
jgi:hypothetical protein